MDSPTAPTPPRGRARELALAAIATAALTLAAWRDLAASPPPPPPPPPRSPRAASSLFTSPARGDSSTLLFRLPAGANASGVDCRALAAGSARAGGGGYSISEMVGLAARRACCAAAARRVAPGASVVAASYLVVVGEDNQFAGGRVGSLPDAVSGALTPYARCLGDPDAHWIGVPSLTALLSAARATAPGMPLADSRLTVVAPLKAPYPQGWPWHVEAWGTGAADAVRRAADLPALELLLAGRVDPGGARDAATAVKGIVEPLRWLGYDAVLLGQPALTRRGVSSADPAAATGIAPPPSCFAARMRGAGVALTPFSAPWAAGGRPEAWEAAAPGPGFWWDAVHAAASADAVTAVAPDGVGNGTVDVGDDVEGASPASCGFLVYLAESHEVARGLAAEAPGPHPRTIAVESPGALLRPVPIDAAPPADPSALAGRYPVQDTLRDACGSGTLAVSFMAAGVTSFVPEAAATVRCRVLVLDPRPGALADVHAWRARVPAHLAARVQAAQVLGTGDHAASGGHRLRVVRPVPGPGAGEPRAVRSRGCGDSTSGSGGGSGGGGDEGGGALVERCAMSVARGVASQLAAAEEADGATASAGPTAGAAGTALAVAPRPAFDAVWRALESMERGLAMPAGSAGLVLHVSPPGLAAGALRSLAPLLLRAPAAASGNGTAFGSAVVGAEGGWSGAVRSGGGGGVDGGGGLDGSGAVGEGGGMGEGGRAGRGLRAAPSDARPRVRALLLELRPAAFAGNATALANELAGMLLPGFTVTLVPANAVRDPAGDHVRSAGAPLRTRGALVAALRGAGGQVVVLLACAGERPCGGQRGGGGATWEWG